MANITHTPPIAPGRGAFAGVFTGLQSEFEASGVLKQLRALQKEWDRLEAQLAAVDNDAAKKALREIKREFAERPTGAAFKKLVDTAEPRAQLKERFRVSMRALKVAMKSFSATEVAPIVAPLWDRAAELLEPHCNALEKAEREAAAFAAVPFESSNSLRATLYKLDFLRSRARSLRESVAFGPGTGSGPKALLEEIGVEL